MKQVVIEGVELSYVGPDLSLGSFPTIFYFALSAKDTLSLDPYNQPIQFIDTHSVRVFSVDLPEHTPPKSPYDAIQEWVKKSLYQETILEDFFLNMKNCIDFLINDKKIQIENLGFMGLSRGAFVASHIASLFSFSLPIVGFSPLIELSKTKEAIDLQYQDSSLDLFSKMPSLINKQIRFYIGNRDTRVHSLTCAKFILQLANLAMESGLRSPPIELTIFPSIGYMGHETPKSIFEDGAKFLEKILTK